MRITPELAAQYARDGFLILKDFTAQFACDGLRERAGKLVHDFNPQGIASIFSTHEQNRLANDYFLESAGKIHFFFEENAFLPDGTLKQRKEESINKIGHALHDLDQVFDEFSRTRELRQLAADLGLTTPLLLQSMYIFKQPRIGGEVGCHQDSTFLYTEQQNIVGLWFALEDATLENGCLWAIPGGHRLGFKQRWRQGAHGMYFETYNSEPWPEGQLVPLEVPKGSLILLHGLLPHKSLANRSSKSRHAYTLHLINADSSYAPDNWLQRPTEMPVRGFN
jgi:phytanoyl-CoA hydroxylase